jgi:hypothetical protein
MTDAPRHYIEITDPKTEEVSKFFLPDNREVVVSGCICGASLCEWRIAGKPVAVVHPYQASEDTTTYLVVDGQAYCPEEDTVYPYPI